MRRLAPSVVLALVVLAVAAPAGGKKPDNVVAWLGSWETNFGTLYFYDAFRERSEFPDADGRRTYHWEIRGRWNRPSGSDKQIEAVLIERDRYRTLSGCWLPPPEPATCGRIFVYRRGSQIRGGYWKDCRQNCRPHHPWRGEKREGAWRVGFRFTQRGHPDKERDARTQIGGAGSIVLRHETQSKGPGRIAAGSRVFVIERFRFDPDEELTIKLTQGDIDRRERRIRASLVGRVTSSNDSSCPTGSRVGMRVVDGRGGVPDKISIGHHGGCKRATRTWTSTDPDRVSVHLTEPRETR